MKDFFSSKIFKKLLFLIIIFFFVFYLFSKIFKFPMWLIFVTTAFLSLVVAFVFYLSINKNIKKFIDVFQKIAKGNFDLTIPSEFNNDFKPLADSFNLMLQEIRNLFSNISSQRDKIKKIFSSIQEAVVMLNESGKIVLYNEKFTQLCKVQPDNRNYWEVLISSEFNELIKEALNSKKNFTQELNIGNKVYLCSGSFVSNKEVVIILYDITEHQNLQNIKKELVTNIIHEIKTPLTNVKGFSETMLDEVENSVHKHYLEIIISNTDRLINIINDLTTIAQLEQGNISLELTYVNLQEVVYDIVSIFENKIKQKNLELKLEIQKNLKPTKADRFRIEQLLINLIDNAIKYTEKGYIRVSVYQDDKYSYIEVEDTGIGIPQEYHQRIFERFFVVDKSRSRQTGGTGLGLAIVKHIVQLHKGEIFVESTPNVGSKFKVVLPLDLL